MKIALSECSQGVVEKRNIYLIVRSPRQDTQYLSRLKKLAASCAHYLPSGSTRYRAKLSHQDERVEVTLEESVKQRTSLNKLSSQSSHPLAMQLLSDVNHIFRMKNISKLRTASLLTALCADTSKPWAILCDGRAISARRLSTILREFGIFSKDIRFKSGVYKGFYSKTFAEACRHLRTT